MSLLYHSNVHNAPYLSPLTISGAKYTTKNKRKKERMRQRDKSLSYPAARDRAIQLVSCSGSFVHDLSLQNSSVDSSFYLLGDPHIKQRFSPGASAARPKSESLTLASAASIVGSKMLSGLKSLQVEVPGSAVGSVGMND
jgi:hypothetical protein